MKYAVFLIVHVMVTKKSTLKDDKKNIKYFMEKMTQEEYEKILRETEIKSYMFNIIKRDNHGL